MAFVVALQKIADSAIARRIQPDDLRILPFDRRRVGISNARSLGVGINLAEIQMDRRNLRTNALQVRR
jgi:hypothetical protein